MGLSKESFLPDEADCAETSIVLRLGAGFDGPTAWSVQTAARRTFKRARKTTATVFTATVAGPVADGLPTRPVRFWKPPT